MKQKMLYFMHVSWGWIKQRPHFLSEKLSIFYDVDIYGLEGIRNRRNNRLNKDKPKRYKPLYLPGFMRMFVISNKTINWLYLVWFNLQVTNFASYKYIWIGNLRFFRFIKNRISDDQIIIYDCMDDDLEFPRVKKNSTLRAYYQNLEKELVNRANFIFFSSSYLSKKVCKRSPFETSKSKIINNAIELPILGNHPDLPFEIKQKIDSIDFNNPILLYIGTISQWFDFELFDSIFKNNPNLKLVLIGPKEIDIPVSSNIIYIGPIERNYIFTFMEKADALCMPFKVNELIRSVNPVKLYEYLYSGKPIIAPFYEETIQFEPYIYLYNNEEEFNQLCKLISNKKLMAKNSFSSSLSFVKENTWDARVKIITDIIMNSTNRTTIK